MIINRRTKIISASLVIITLILIGLSIGIYSIIQFQNGQSNGDVPILKNLGIEFAEYNDTTNKAGDFLFLEHETKVFFEFGAIVSTGNGFKILPTFEYRLAKDANIVACCNGYIDQIFYQSSTDDYEILIRPNEDSEWHVSHDHVTDLEVSEGDFVVAGDLLGKPGTWSDQLGRTEILINYNPTETYYAPFEVFDEETRSQYQQKVWDLMEDWETFKGDTTIYDENKMIYAGCYNKSIKDSELQL